MKKLIFLVLLLLSVKVLACSTGSVSLKETVDSSDLIFHGFPIFYQLNKYYDKENERHGDVLIEYFVIEHFKGSYSKKHKVYTDFGPGSCGAPIDIYDSYIVVAKKNREGIYVTSIANGTKPYKDEDIDFLRNKYKKEKL